MILCVAQHAYRQLPPITNLIQHLPPAVTKQQLVPLICAQQHPAQGLSQCWEKLEGCGGGPGMGWSGCVRKVGEMEAQGGCAGTGNVGKSMQRMI